MPEVDRIEGAAENSKPQVMLLHSFWRLHQTFDQSNGHLATVQVDVLDHVGDGRQQDLAMRACDDVNVVCLGKNYFADPAQVFSFSDVELGAAATIMS